MHKRFVPPDVTMPEFTWRGLVPGILLGIIFGAANAYLGLRAGLTISTSIPIAVMTVAVYKLIRGNILEANMSQTIGSASSSVASGVIFTLPALFLWGLAAVAAADDAARARGRRARHAVHDPAAEVPHRERARDVAVSRGDGVRGSADRESGWGTGARRVRRTHRRRGVQGASSAASGSCRTRSAFTIPFLRKGELATEVSAALFGVGYILGPRVGAVMVGGGLLSSLVIIPIIAYWGAGADHAVLSGAEAHHRRR